MTKRKNRLFIDKKQKHDRSHTDPHEAAAAKAPVRGVMRKTVPKPSHQRNRDIGQR